MFENVLLSILFWGIILGIIIFDRTLVIAFSAMFVGLLAAATQQDNQNLGTILYILSGLCLLVTIFMGYKLYKLAQKGEMKKNKDGFPKLD